MARLRRLRRGIRRTHARADVWERVRGVPRRRPALDTADDPMAVGMIGGSPLRGREAERDRWSRTSGASQRATTNSLGTTSQPCASLPPWHSGFNQLSLNPRVKKSAYFLTLLASILTDGSSSFVENAL